MSLYEKLLLNSETNGMEIHEVVMYTQFLVTASKVWYSLCWNRSYRQIESVTKKGSKENPESPSESEKGGKWNNQ